MLCTVTVEVLSAPAACTVVRVTEHTEVLPYIDAHIGCPGVATGGRASITYLPAGTVTGGLLSAGPV